MDTIIDLERADSNIEIAKVKVADADVKIVRASNYIKVSMIFYVQGGLEGNLLGVLSFG